MSVAMMTRVWALDIPHHEQAVLLALADHADDRGGNCFPSMGYVAWKLGYSDRQVRRIVSDLRSRGVLVITRMGRGKFPPHYRLVLGSLPQKAPYRDPETDKMSDAEMSTDSIPDKMSYKDAPGAVTLTPATADPDTGDVRDDISDADPDISDAVYDTAVSSKPSLVNRHIEPSREPSPESSPRARDFESSTETMCSTCGEPVYAYLGGRCVRGHRSSAEAMSDSRASRVAAQPDSSSAPPPSPEEIARWERERLAARASPKTPVGAATGGDDNAS